MGEEPERRDQERIIQALVGYLQNIARGYWNVGRPGGELVSVHEYARQALAHTGFAEDEDRL